MKKTFIIFMFLFLIGLMDANCKAESTNINIDKTSFPGESLRRYILKDIDINKDGLLSDKECADVKCIVIDNPSIAEDDDFDKKSDYDKLSEEEKNNRYHMIDLSGLQNFPNLDDLTLIANGKFINLNVIAKIKKLKSVTLGGSFNSINYNLAKLRNLRSLSLKEIDCKDITIKGNSKLSKVDLYMVRANKITINNNKKLTKITTEFLRIKNCQCKNNKLLKGMEIYGDDRSFGTYKKSNSIKKMYIHNNPKLKSVDIRYFKKLKKVDLVKNKNLRALELACTPSLKKVFLKKNKSSRKLKIEKNGQKIRIYKNK